jgi:hypothetical protein
MFELYDKQVFHEHIKNNNFYEIAVINRYKDFKYFKVYLGRKYNDVFIVFEDQIYISSVKNLKIEDTIAFFYEINKDKIMLSTYNCESKKNIKNLLTRSCCASKKYLKNTILQQLQHYNILYFYLIFSVYLVLI